jgi:hypothetical protein
MDVSFIALGAGGITGVRVDVAVCPVTSVTRYVTGVLVPDVAPGSASNVTVPVILFTVHVPCPVTVNVSLQTESDGSTRQGPAAFPVCRPVPEARPPDPMRSVNVAVPPGTTCWVSGVAVGAGGGETVGVIVADVFAPNESVT